MAQHLDCCGVTICAGQYVTYRNIKTLLEVDLGQVVDIYHDAVLVEWTDGSRYSYLPLCLRVLEEGAELTMLRLKCSA